jgi:Calcineurin-like phosphoesterase
MRIAVIADSHFHPPGIPAQAAWASDALFNARNAAVVQQVRHADPALVVHLGDVVHPIPGLPEHEVALAVARDTYADLGRPLLVVPGNHDVGDKLHPWAPAPSVSDGKHDTFRRWWGAPWWAHYIEQVRLVAVDTPLLGSGLPLEEEHWAWLEATLTPDGPRTFVFLHYPPFLLDPNEPDHYDNLARPVRDRLLALLAAARVEAVFCGHVHHPFWNRWQGIDFYLLPSTAFVRPEYSELGRVGPADEFGRNDTERLGFCLLDVSEHGHHVQWVRTGGATVAADEPFTAGRCSLGLTLRHRWDAVLDLPADGLDPYRRKRARNDLVLLATAELGVPLLRLPIDDLRDDASRERLFGWADRGGLQVVLFAAEPLTDRDRALIDAHRAHIRAVELIVPRAQLERELPELAVSRWVAPHGRRADEVGAYFSHFAPLGFTLGDPDLTRAVGEGVVYRVEADADLEQAVAHIEAAEAGRNRTGVALVLTPRAGESAVFTDDAAIARQVVAAEHAARAHPRVPVILDTAVDHDRGYFPRHGLVDRRGNPRAAFTALARLARGLDSVKSV